MGLLRFIRDVVTGRTGRPVSEWFSVEFDSDVVRVASDPPGRKPWSQQFGWAEIERICFKAEGLATSDGIYVFTRRRPESFAIPIEAGGGQEFWSEIINRRLFDAELAIRAASSTGGTFWWPSEPTPS